MMKSSTSPIQSPIPVIINFCSKIGSVLKYESIVSVGFYSIKFSEFVKHEMISYKIYAM